MGCRLLRVVGSGAEKLASQNATERMTQMSRPFRNVLAR